ncbi:MAG: LysR substrate-binding domain-containing protein [Cellvibrionaceae bacterium]
MPTNPATLKQVRAFVAIARSRSFAEAAAQLHLSQPALSSAIKNLEQAVGGQLLTRTTRAFSLTPEGESFLPTAQRLLTEWDDALEDVHNRFALRTGRITIAAMPSFAANLLPAGLAAYKRVHPKVRVALHDVIAEEVVRMVRSGKAEIGISFYPGEHEDLLFTPLFEDHFVAVMAADHKLSVQEGVTLEDLAQQDLITLQAPSQVRGLIADFFQQHQLPFTPALEAHQLVTVGRMVASGLGVSLVPALSEQQMREVGACCRPLIEAKLSRQVGILTRKRYPLSAASKAMMEIFIATFVEASVKG